LTEDQVRLTDAAWIKWRSGETLSRPDMERLLSVFESADLKIEILDQATVAGLQTRMRSILSQKYLPNNK
jgi:hypothetical protein